VAIGASGPGWLLMGGKFVSWISCSALECVWLKWELGLAGKNFLLRETSVAFGKVNNAWLLES